MEPQSGSQLPILPSYGASDPPPRPEIVETDEGPAVDLIRQKIESLYGPGSEPSVMDELELPKSNEKILTKHQHFMQNLTKSDKSLAEIQTAWHNYYSGLPDDEKHAVWQEFYSQHDHASRTQTPVSQQAVAEQPNHKKAPKSHKKHRSPQMRSAAEVRKQIVDKVNAGGKLKPKHHIQSLIFGLGIGSIVILVLLFSFFNERIIAPFISPSKQVSSTPIIIDPTSANVGPDPKIIIPKINVEIPVDYTQKSVDEKAIQKSLENGVIHYPTTVLPGEHGNATFFGHSSNNIFNKGKYKFAFVLLSRLENGDVFYLTKDGKQYAYRVYDKRVVKPTDLYVLDTRDKSDTATLITCDPPGTSINRLAVTGEQISPDPNANVATVDDTAQQKQPDTLPSNAPSLWSRLLDLLSN